MRGREVSRDLLAPTKEDCLRAISIALLNIRAAGHSMPKIAAAMGCDQSTIKSASDEDNLLRFDFIAAMAFHFPDEFKKVEALWTCRPAVPLTAADRLERISNEVEAIKREIGE